MPTATATSAVERIRVAVFMAFLRARWRNGRYARAIRKEKERLSATWSSTTRIAPRTVLPAAPRGTRIVHVAAPATTLTVLGNVRVPSRKRHEIRSARRPAAAGPAGRRATVAALPGAAARGSVSVAPVSNPGMAGGAP